MAGLHDSHGEAFPFVRVVAAVYLDTEVAVGIESVEVEPVDEGLAGEGLGAETVLVCGAEVAWQAVLGTQGLVGEEVVCVPLGFAR